MSVANNLETLIMKDVFANTSFAQITAVWAALHTATPGETCTASPLASTPRSSITFNTPTSAAVQAAAITWVVSSTGTITDISLWDGSATATANALWYGTLTASKTVANVGDTVTAASGAITVTLS